MHHTVRLQRRVIGGEHVEDAAIRHDGREGAGWHDGGVVSTRWLFEVCGNERAEEGRVLVT
jgi:hypothetical protein